MNRESSLECYDRALDVLVGGVNSSVRAAPQPYPTYIQSGDAGHVVDADGNRYIDWVMGLGPLLLGHNLPESVQAAIQKRASQGPMYGMPTELEVEHAEFIVRHVPSVEMVRFVNSGTEATTSAVRLARGVTGRNKIVIMQSSYHGAQESTLVEGDAEHPQPSSDGIPQSFTEHTIPVSFNDANEVTQVFERHGDEIACVLVEPILANKGIVEPVEGYHETLRDLTREHGSLLVWDEVITGFRVGGLGCAQSKFGVTPDLTTFGKIIGGGFPVGAIGGRTDLMEQFTPVGDVFQAGTFSGHPVTMAAGLKALEFAAENDVYEHVNGLGNQLREGISEIIAERTPEYSVVGTDSMFKVVFTHDGQPPKNGADVASGAVERWNRVFRPQMLDDGILLSQNQFESQFVSYGHTEEDVERTLEAYESAL